MKEKFIESFEKLDFSFDVPFANSLRKQGLDAISKLEFPTSKTEYWKYTRLNSILKKTYSTRAIEEIENLDEAIPSNNCLVFINGLFQEDLSWMAENSKASFMPLSMAKEKHSDLVESKLGKLSPIENEIFSAINTAFHQDGAFLHVPKAIMCEEAFFVLNLIEDASIVCNPRNLVIAEEGSSAKMVIKTRSIGGSDQHSLTNMVSEFFIEESANFEINKVQQEASTSFQIAQEEAQQETKSCFKINTFTLDGSIVRNNLNIHLLGEHTETWLNGLYLTKDKQHVDNHTYVLHRAPNCVSHELYKGILDEQSTGVFNGKVYVHQEAQKTNAYQSNANMVLSDSASANSKPELEIYADDVKCSHGSVTGQLDEEAIFYLRSRGLSEKNAKAALLNAFANDVIEQIGIPSIKEEMADYIDQHYQAIT